MALEVFIVCFMLSPGYFFTEPLKSFITGFLGITFLILCFLFLVFSPIFCNWNFLLMTESSSISLGLIIISLFYRLMANKTRSWAFLLKIIPALILFSILRDANAIIAVLIVLASAVYFIMHKRNSVFLILFIISLTLFFYSIYGINNKEIGFYERWVFPTLNNFYSRVQTHPDFKSFSKANNIPVSDQLNRDCKPQNPTESHRIRTIKEF